MNIYVARWLGARRSSLTCLVSIILFLLGLPSFAGAQTVDEVIAKNIQAHGGLDKLKEVKTLRISGKFSQGPFRAGFVQENKRPEKVREEALIQGLVQIQAYDGKTGWQVSPFGGRRDAELMSQDDVKSLVVDADIDGPLVDYKGKGHKAELVGHDSVEGTDCFKVRLTLKNGDVRLYFFDADSFLEIKMENQSTIRGAVQFTENFYGDYEQVNGIYYPFAFENGEKGSTNRAKFTVEKVEQNLPLDDSLFSMPASKPEPKAAAAGEPKAASK